MVDVRSLLCLSAIPRLGPLKIRSLVAHFRSPAEVLKASPRELIRAPGIDKTLATAIARHKASERFADEQLSLANKAGARIVTLWDSEYPSLLKAIYDPPPFFFALGSIATADQFCLAVVGTRRPGPYGQKAADSFATDLARSGLTIVSGLARGIDTLAHTASLAAGGRTIAVIGSGVDVPYPPENRGLMRRIERSGAVISEFPMGTKPDAHHFPRRNRIISGLSLGTLILESREDGGAMITASTALDQNREVFAVPGNVFDERNAGPNRLIREGQAKLVTRVEDILEELQSELKPILRPRTEPETLPALTLFERSILDILDSDATHIDAISEKTRLATSDALVSLLSLEFKGLVRQLPGKIFSKI